MTDNHNSEGYPTYQEGNQYTSPTMAAISKIMESENKTQNSSSDFTVKEKNIYYKKIKLKKQYIILLKMLNHRFR